MSETLSSGLTITIPTEGDENWASSIKALCFQKISEHDHTGSGKGVQIGTTALAASAVTTAKIADSNVTTAKIANDAVTEAKLDADAATRSCILVEAYASVANGTISIQELPRALASGQTTRSRMPKAGKVTHLSINSQTGKNGGTLTITLYKNGSTTSKTLTLPNSENASGSITAESFAAGDTLSLAITTSSVTFTSPPADLIATAWGHFTE